MKKISMRTAKKLPEGQPVVFKVFGEVIGGAITQSEERRKEVRAKFNSSPLLRGIKYGALGIAKVVGMEIYTAEFVRVSAREASDGDGIYLYSKDGKSYSPIPKGRIAELVEHEFVAVV